MSDFEKSFWQLVRDVCPGKTQEQKQFIEKMIAEIEGRLYGESVSKEEGA